MARRRKRDNDGIGLVAQMAALVILACLTLPQARQAIAAISVVAIWLLGMAVAGLIGFIVYRLSTRGQRQASNDTFTVISRIDAPVPGLDVNRSETLAQGASVPQTTAVLLEQLRAIDWFQFEKLVALSYHKLGYTVTRRGGAKPDGGIDLVIEKNGQLSAVQCKQWRTWNVGVKAVREFLGALTDAGIAQGIFITLCGYTAEAKQLAEKHGIEIVNDAGLARLLEATGIQSDPETLVILRDTNNFCPKCESQMVLRTATKGKGSGQQFWGCSTYPKCRYTMPA